MINVERLWSRIEELSGIGKTADNGVTRFSYTREEYEANELVKRYMQQAGLEVYYDAVGNLIGSKSGNKDLPTILLGSHIDTVPNGGKFDGSLGVLTAIEVMESLQDQQILLDHPVKVIAFKDEEGSRFGFGMIGSLAVAGNLNSKALERKDKDGFSIRDALIEYGYDPENIQVAQMTDVKMYLELHIEQGKVLENNEAPVGIVTGIAGPLWLKFKLTGEAEHAGATPMGQRKDPLVAASLIIAEIEKLANQYEDAVATVGTLSLTPGGVNVIPGSVEFTIDLRDISEQVRGRLEKEIRDFATTIVSERKIDLTIEELQRVAPVICSQQIQETIQQSISELDYPVVSLPSGAGHDAMQFKDAFPVGMIFVRSKDGISHNPKEFTAKEDVKAGAEVMLRTLIHLDKS
ncbi:Zn-dependent hydrolase [Alkalihalobacterium elongatum]|uniref:Zn-dependent hydrolase n=1 Tax=Alkalihalobacterium elongatum TaxID=2675466 RepID=UPI001C1FB794|nr:Zn-dependent hydrolase [Alkalihalobacterium elongatum]